MTEAPFSPLRAGLFAVLALGAMYFALLPMQLRAGSMILPDLVLVLAAAWAVRRPDSMPLLLVAAVLLLADFMLARPVGLWALISLLIVEAMRAQREAYRNRPFVVEWGGFALALALGMIAQGLVLRIALVERPEGELPLRLFAITLAAYPAVAAALHYVFRIRSPKPAERSRRLGRVT